MKRIIIVLILIVLLMNLTSCKQMYYWEADTHEEFADYIEKYGELHDLHVDTFISFDLDDKDEVLTKQYTVFSMISPFANDFERKHGYICDFYSDVLAVRFLYYLRGDEENANEYAYKIKCTCSRVGFNYTEDDEIDILPSECSTYNESSNPSFDSMYEESVLRAGEGVDMYSYYYHYSVYVNNVKACCIHISSIDEPSKEKLEQIVQMLKDSIVVLNAEGMLLWSDK